jgi:hypothetical protein
MYLTITSEETLSSLAFNLVYREREVHQYQINIDNYTAMLAILPQGEPPAEILQYMSTKTEELPFDVPLETVQVVADYQYRDRIRYLIRTEAIEQGKAKRVLDALKAQLPADQLDALVADALVKVNAQSAPSA